MTGYVRTGSVPSIAAGVTVGALVRYPPSVIAPPNPNSSVKRTNKKADVSKYGLGGLRMRQRQPYGPEISLLASVVLAGSSVPRAIKTQEPLPLGLSALALFGLFQFGMAVQRGRA